LSATEWTREMPTEPGWYWHYTDDSGVEVLSVYEGIVSTRLRVFVSEYETPTLAQFHRGKRVHWWLGPLAVPEVPR